MIVTSECLEWVFKSKGAVLSAQCSGSDGGGNVPGAALDTVAGPELILVHSHSII